MSEGPIKSWRDAWKPEKAPSTSTAVHGRSKTPGRAYCGRKTTALAQDWDGVTCWDCLAALRADQEAQRV